MRIIVSRPLVAGPLKTSTGPARNRGNWPGSRALAHRSQARRQAPLHMGGPGESPSEQPQGDQPGEDASHQHEGLAELEQIGAGDNEGLDDDAEAAGDHDRGAERGDEDRDWVLSAVAGTRVGFRVHGRPSSGDAVESTRGPSGSSARPSAVLIMRGAPRRMRPNSLGLGNVAADFAGSADDLDASGANEAVEVHGHVIRSPRAAAREPFFTQPTTRVRQ